MTAHNINAHTMHAPSTIITHSSHQFILTATPLADGVEDS